MNFVWTWRVGMPFREGGRMKSSLMYISRSRGTISGARAHSEWYGRIQLRTIYILKFAIV